MLLVRWYFDPEDGGDTFLRNVGSYNSHTASHLRRWYSCEYWLRWSRHWSDLYANSRAVHNSRGGRGMLNLLSHRTELGTDPWFAVPLSTQQTRTNDYIWIRINVILLSCCLGNPKETSAFNTGSKCCYTTGMIKGKGESIEMCTVDRKDTVPDIWLYNAMSFLNSAAVKRTALRSARHSGHMRRAWVT
jgi:hypothetical protein